MQITEKELKLTKKRIESLQALGIFDTDELFSYYPFRYDVLNTNDYSTWKVKEYVTFEGKVVGTVRSWGFGKKTNVKFDVEAFDHILHITIFHRPWAKNLYDGQTVTINGVYMGGDKVTAMSYDTKPLKDHDAITPVYSTRANIKQKTIRDSIHKVYEIKQNEIDDLIPEPFISQYQLLRRYDAIRKIHFPETMEEVHQAYRTLKYEEFLKFFTTIQLLKNEDDQGIIKAPKQFDQSKIDQMINHLPFELTSDQQKALDEILKDLSSNKVMYRLVQGDVGCGKTVIAAISMYASVLAGYQAALLAPTEILARQHYLSLQSLLKDTDVNIAVLYSGLSNAEKKEILSQLEEGSIDIIVGTHSLIQEGVNFAKLGYVVADEQQRFGVKQRRALKEKGEHADFLLMSATPIPRTLASTLFGDMDISTIETMPAGRKAPITKYIEENSFRSVLDDVNALLARGNQLYVICAAVEQNDDYKARDVIETANQLTKLFKDYNVGVLHGRMSSEEKQTIMAQFSNNEIQVLVSTTVVEVGMNVVNATGMIIYDADRFGLSQLHQLRGRIQRGNYQGECWLLSSSEDEKVKERLQVLVNSNDGFEISYQDLRLRGPGDILGTRQSGIPDFILGNVIEDTKIIQQAQKDAKMIVEHQDDPSYDMLLGWIRAKNENAVTYMD